MNVGYQHRINDAILTIDGRNGIGHYVATRAAAAVAESAQPRRCPCARAQEQSAALIAMTLAQVANGLATAAERLGYLEINLSRFGPSV